MQTVSCKGIQADPQPQLMRRGSARPTLSTISPHAAAAAAITGTGPRPLCEPRLHLMEAAFLALSVSGVDRTARHSAARRGPGSVAG